MRERPAGGQRQLGYAKQPDELRVADLPVTDADGDGTAGGRASTPGVDRAGTVTVAQAPGLAGLTVVQDPTEPFDRLTLQQIMDMAADHAGGVVEVLGPFRLMLSQANNAEGWKGSIERSRQAATEALQNAGAPEALVAGAPDEARSAMWNAGVDLLRLSLIARDVGTSRVAAGGRIARSAAHAAEWAGELDASAAAARDAAAPQVLPENAGVWEDRYTVGGVVRSAVLKAADLTAAGDLQLRRPGDAQEADKVELDRLVADIKANAALAEHHARQGEREQARDAMAATIEKYRQLSAATARIGGKLAGGRGVPRGPGSPRGFTPTRCCARCALWAPGRGCRANSSRPFPACRGRARSWLRMSDRLTPRSSTPGSTPKPTRGARSRRSRVTAIPPRPTPTSPSRASSFLPASRERWTSPAVATPGPAAQRRPTPPTAPRAPPLPQPRPCARTMQPPRPPTPMRSLARTSSRRHSTTASCSPSWPPAPPLPTLAEVAAEPSQLSRTRTGTTDRP